MAANQSTQVHCRFRYNHLLERGDDFLHNTGFVSSYRLQRSEKLGILTTIVFSLQVFSSTSAKEPIRLPGHHRQSPPTGERTPLLHRRHLRHLRPLRPRPLPLHPPLHPHRSRRPPSFLKGLYAVVAAVSSLHRGRPDFFCEEGDSHVMVWGRCLWSRRTWWWLLLLLLLF